MMFGVVPALMPQVGAGKFRALAAGSANRLPILPDVPGMPEFADLGLAGMDIQASPGSPAGPAMPDEVVTRLHAAIATAGRDPESGAKLAPLGKGPVASGSPVALRARIARDAAQGSAGEGLRREAGLSGGGRSRRQHACAESLRVCRRHARRGLPGAAVRREVSRENATRIA